MTVCAAFSTNHAILRGESKNWLALNRENVSRVEQNTFVY